MRVGERVFGELKCGVTGAPKVKMIGGAEALLVRDAHDERLCVEVHGENDFRIGEEGI